MLGRHGDRLVRDVHLHDLFERLHRPLRVERVAAEVEADHPPLLGLGVERGDEGGTLCGSKMPDRSCSLSRCSGRSAATLRTAWASAAGSRGGVGALLPAKGPRPEDRDAGRDRDHQSRGQWAPASPHDRHPPGSVPGIARKSGGPEARKPGARYPVPAPVFPASPDDGIGAPGPVNQRHARAEVGRHAQQVGRPRGRGLQPISTVLRTTRRGPRTPLGKPFALTGPGQSDDSPTGNIEMGTTKTGRLVIIGGGKEAEEGRMKRCSGSSSLDLHEFDHVAH